MDENKYTYPESLAGITFSEEEKKRWKSNLKKLIKRVERNFKPSRKHKKRNG